MLPNDWDTRDTDPEIQLPEEPPTRPDVRRVRCPKCRGEGQRQDVICTLCKGEKTVDHQTLAAHHAIGQGRPR